MFQESTVWSSEAGWASFKKVKDQAQIYAKPTRNNPQNSGYIMDAYILIASKLIHILWTLFSRSRSKLNRIFSIHSSEIQKLRLSCIGLSIWSDFHSQIWIFKAPNEIMFAVFIGWQQIIRPILQNPFWPLNKGHFVWATSLLSHTSCGLASCSFTKYSNTAFNKKFKITGELFVTWYKIGVSKSQKGRTLWTEWQLKVHTGHKNDAVM